LNLKRYILLSSAFLLCCSAGAGPASGQPMAKQLVADFGLAYTQATVSGAPSGLVGLDLHTGKMLTNNLSVGIAVGFDVVSFRKVGGIYERLSIIPILAKGKYYFNIAPLLQVHASAAGGVYKTLPHLATGSIGGVSASKVKAGGSAGAGFDYWFMGTKGIGAEVEYNVFPYSNGKRFSYLAFRVNLIMTKL